MLVELGGNGRTFSPRFPKTQFSPDVNQLACFLKAFLNKHGLRKSGPLCVNVYMSKRLSMFVLTLGFLALAGRPPADTGAMLIQVEEANQALGAVLQFHHLSA